MDLNKARKLALRLMKKHLLLSEVVRHFDFGPGRSNFNKVVVPAGTPWKFDFDRSKRQFGCCDYSKRTITLSRHLVLLNDEDQVRDTILHEIAHANVDSAAGHGPKWVAEALRLGCNAKACYNASEVREPPSPWIGWCPGCKKQFKRFRRPPAYSHSCDVCSPRVYNSEFQLQWVRRQSFDNTILDEAILDLPPLEGEAQLEILL